MTRFLPCSILLHVLVILALGQYGLFTHGLDSRKINLDRTRTVSVMIAADRESQPLPDKSIAVNSNELMARKTEADKDLSLAGAAATKKGSSSGKENDELVASNGKEKSLRDANSMNEYFLAGGLTRLPAPLMPVDLNVPDITNRAAGRPIEITLFIDAAGVVSNIVNSDNDEKTREFFELVALQFRNSRFSPGEIDGRKVNSRITITVVSEPV